MTDREAVARHLANAAFQAGSDFGGNWETYLGQADEIIRLVDDARNPRVRAMEERAERRAMLSAKSAVGDPRWLERRS